MNDANTMDDPVGEGPCILTVRRAMGLAVWEMRLEMELRRGPQWRCTCCGWLWSGWDRALAPVCPCCDTVMNVTRRSPRRAISWPLRTGKEERWVREVAVRCGWRDGAAGADAVPGNLSVGGGGAR